MTDPPRESLQVGPASVDEPGIAELLTASVGRTLLAALRRLVPAGLPIVAETDSDAVGFYRANGFDVESLGSSYVSAPRLCFF